MSVHSLACRFNEYPASSEAAAEAATAAVCGKGT
jgi:hypothetical protein